MHQAPRIFVVHALRESLAPVAQAFAGGWPEAQVCNLMDDSLSRDRASGEGGDEAFDPRFSRLIDYCVTAGANGILFACSAFHGAIERTCPGAGIPVLKPDEAMIARALDTGESFAVVATFRPSIEALGSQIEASAEMLGRPARIEGVFVDGAMEYLSRGEYERHDAVIADAVAAVSGVDAVLLAQFSMARAAPAAARRSRAPVLTSPAAAVARLRSMLAP